MLPTFANNQIPVRFLKTRLDSANKIILLKQQASIQLLHFKFPTISPPASSSRRTVKSPSFVSFQQETEKLSIEPHMKFLQSLVRPTEL